MPFDGLPEREFQKLDEMFLEILKILAIKIIYSSDGTGAVLAMGMSRCTVPSQKTWR